jgi:hypothetical protein
LLEGRLLLQLQKGNARPAAKRRLVLRSTKGKDLPIKVSENAYLFRTLASSYIRLVLWHGWWREVTFHLNTAGEIDYLEVRPITRRRFGGKSFTIHELDDGIVVRPVQARLARYARGIGAITDVRVAARGSSRRAIDSR